ncbi:MAG TPA: 2-amino-4-hydroxy-6-hydroxymethyldihydropteridine diphosphokinase [Jatrophihabitans sp.]|nr:2-amino-4-hydroxy-6-hydroxymethyldihydropteridine diphosphokinase [Jatrophihabitans sp.]
MSRAVLSVGSNLGDPLAALQLAVGRFAGQLVAVSPVYRTPPWGPVVQDDFFNAVLVVADDRATPAGWLARAQACEQAAGRTREVRWGPRTLDVDVVTVDQVRSDDPVLTLPHPRAAERAFVLVPWLAADPAAELPGHGAVRELVAALPAAEVAGVRLEPGAELAW